MNAKIRHVENDAQKEYVMEMVDALVQKKIHVWFMGVKEKSVEKVVSLGTQWVPVMLLANVV